MHHPRGLWCHCTVINPLNAELNPIWHLLALLGAHHILHVSRVRVTNSVNPAYSGTAMALFFRCQQVQFNTGNFSLYPRDRCRFQLKTGLRYAQVPFKTGFLVQRLLTYKSCAFKRFPLKLL